MDRQELESYFEVNVAKETFKFNAAHFVAYPGFRERLHGHNYKIAVRLIGSKTIMNDGYLIDFGEVKDVTKLLCKELNEHFICPTLSPSMEILASTSSNGAENVELICEDGAKFSFPKTDCAMLPIAHSTAEELAIYFWGRILNELRCDYLLKRGIHTMEVRCAEAVGQEASFRRKIPENQENLESLCNVTNYIVAGDLIAKPCLPVKTKDCCPHCKK